jgi:hypothetical protein
MNGGKVAQQCDTFNATKLTILKTGLSGEFCAGYGVHVCKPSTCKDEEIGW